VSDDDVAMSEEDDGR